MNNPIDIYLLHITKIISRFIYKWTGITNYTLTKICIMLAVLSIALVMFFIAIKPKQFISGDVIELIILFVVMMAIYFEWLNLKQNLELNAKFLNPGRIHPGFQMKRIFLLGLIVLHAYNNYWGYCMFNFFWFMALCFGSIEPEDPNDSMLKKALNYLSGILAPSPVPQMG